MSFESSSKGNTANKVEGIWMCSRLRSVLSGKAMVDRRKEQIIRFTVGELKF